MPSYIVQELWGAVEQNALIAASGTQIFAATTNATQNRSKYGSMNTLVLTNNSSNTLQLYLDGNLYAEIFARSQIILGVEDGLYFDLIKIINGSAVDAIAANGITIRYGRSKIIR